MTGRAPRASDIAGATWFAPWPIAAFAVAATITAATTTGHDPTVMVAGVIGIAGFVTLLLRVEWGIIAMAAFAILRLADVATDFHGAPSLFQPLVAVIVCGIGLRWLATGARPAGGARAALVLGFYVLIAAASLLFATDVDAGTGALDFLVKDAAVAVLTGILLHRGSTLRAVIWVWVGGAGLLATISTFQFLTSSFDNNFFGLGQSAVQNIVGATDDVRISGPIGDPNFYGQLLVMALPLATERERMLRLAAGATAALIAASIVFTFSRGTAVAAVVVVAIMAVAHPPKPGLVAAVAVAGVLALPMLPPGYVERMLTLGQIGSVDSGTDVSIRGRTAEVNAGWNMFLDHPVTGVGIGNFKSEYVEYARPLGIELRREPREPHNLYLEVGAETGLPGIAAFGAIFAAAFTALGRSRRRLLAVGRPGEASMAYALIAALVGYLLTAIFLHLAFARFFWMVIGVALAMPNVAATAEREHAGLPEAAWR